MKEKVNASAWEVEWKSGGDAHILKMHAAITENVHVCIRQGPEFSLWYSISLTVNEAREFQHRAFPRPGTLPEYHCVEEQEEHRAQTMCCNRISLSYNRTVVIWISRNSFTVIEITNWIRVPGTRARGELTVSSIVGNTNRINIT